MRPRAVVLFSGGLDSTVLAYKLAADGYDLHLLSVDYGQRHITELSYAATTAAKLRARHTVVYSHLSALLPSSLTGSGDIPHGHYAAESMRSTVVPSRNAILLAMCWGAAVVDQAVLVAIGAHAGDHPVYPDCRPGFLDALDDALRLGTADQGAPGLRIEAPFLARTKGEIVEVGLELAVPFGDTWSCYEGLDLHCGRCGTCVERIEAFDQAGVIDPTAYLPEAAS